MNLKKQFPQADGWITARLTLNRGATFTEQEAKNAILFGRSPDEVEFGYVNVLRNPVVVVYREFKERVSAERLARPWSNHNLNDFIRFKLTDKGRAHVDELNRTHPVYSSVPLRYEPDAEGWIETTLWDFSNVFGETFMMGFDQTVETSIQLQACF